MKVTTMSLPQQKASQSTRIQPLSKKELIISYYEKAGPDYQTWSKNYNMHFGYWKKGINPLNREAMLEQLNEKVFEKLSINHVKPFAIADLGCGLGASLRYGAKKFPSMKGKGITLVPWQVDQAKSLNKESKATESIEIIEGDYCNTRFADNSLDAVIAIESSCYASGDNKSDLLNEIQRVLKPGGRFVISDGFLKKPLGSKGLLRSVYDQLCASWALTELGNIKEVENHLKQLKFKNIEIEDVSMNIAPSVAHVPFTVIYFLIKELLFGKERMSKERWDNLKSPLLTMVLGSARSHFGYYFVSGTKGES
ncbi:MAG: methyltransferase domain-containing protein [Cyclobacteriaceae bacterium]|nr:methyltransferase domain-containing protein [Cyclobacteriaceae bacterium]